MMTRILSSSAKQWLNACVALLCLIGARSLQGQVTEVRGTWLTTTGPDHIRTGLNTESITQSLRNVGLNTVYVEAWKNGYTNFPSSTLASVIGVDRAPTLGTRDLLDETLVHAHRKNMQHVGWFEYGFSTQFIGSTGTPNNPLSVYMLNRQSTVGGQTVQGWLLRDQQGRYGNASNGFAWMNPAVPEVRQFLINLALDAVRRYDLDGIQFDDRLAWPREFGWDATTAAYYLAETGRNLPSSISDSHFRTWRQGKVTLFATELYQALKAADPNLLVSVSPSVTGFSDTNYNAPWSQWVAEGLFDEYVPQVYRSTYSSFQQDLPANIAPFTSANRQDDMVVGIRFNGTGGDTPLADVQQMVQLTRTSGGGNLAGHSLWYSSGVITNQSAMATFYNGQAQHPKFPADHRPAPIVGIPTGQPNTWRVQVHQAGNYRIAAKVGSFWNDQAPRFFAPGQYDLTLPGATQVELLVSRRLTPQPILNGDFNGDLVWDCADVDRLVISLAAGWQDLTLDLNQDRILNHADLDRWRVVAGQRLFSSAEPVIPGDVNLDGVVDGVDFGFWNRHRMTSAQGWCAGDLTADGLINGADFRVWEDHKFQRVTGMLIPEPNASVLPWLSWALWFGPGTLRTGRKLSTGTSERLTEFHQESP